jgi:hypothetical protein
MTGFQKKYRNISRNPAKNATIYDVFIPSVGNGKQLSNDPDNKKLHIRS